MKNIIVNIQYCNSISCLFSTLMQAALSWNHFHADNDIIFLESVKKYKNSIEHAKKYRDAIHWSPSDCIKGLVEGNNVVIAYIKKILCRGIWKSIIIMDWKKPRTSSKT